MRDDTIASLAAHFYFSIMIRQETYPQTYPRPMLSHALPKPDRTLAPAVS